MRILLIITGMVIGCAFSVSADPSDLNSLEGYFPELSAAQASPALGNTETRMDPAKIIGGMRRGDTLHVIGNGIVKFPIEFINREEHSFVGESYYRVISPDGANWAHPTATGGNLTPSNAGPGIWVDTTGIYPRSDFIALYTFRDWGADGLGEDTVTLSAFSNDPASQRGIRPADSGIFFYIVVRLKSSDIGKHICIDTSERRLPTGTFRWGSYAYPGPVQSYSTVPFWAGRQCFVIGDCCVDRTGNYDCDPEDKVDISDVSAFVARYIDPQLPCCPGEANTDGSPDGLSDISDLSRLIDYLFISFTPPEPCQ